MWNDRWTGDGTLWCPGGGHSILYDPQPIRDRPDGGVGDFHTVRGGINPGDIHVRSWVVGVVYVWMDDDLGMEPYRPQMTVTLCTIPINERLAIRQK